MQLLERRHNHAERLFATVIHPIILRASRSSCRYWHPHLKGQRGCGTIRMYGLGAFQPFG